MATVSKPRISVNKLAEYLEANSIRRKRIVEDAKYPKAWSTTRYKGAREVMKAYLIDRNEDPVLAFIEELRTKSTSTDFQEQDRVLSIAALESLLDMDFSILDGVAMAPFEEEHHLININGVDISVYPDLVATKGLQGKTTFGALKLHASKTNILTEESQNIVAVMLYNYASTFLSHIGETASPKVCFSIDVFAQNTAICPAAYKQRLARIEIACEEIAMWWDKL